MARIHRVKKAQKEQGACEICREPIHIGMSYQWVQPRAYRGAAGYKRKRHVTCRTWRPSELSSSKMASVMAAGEMFADGRPYATVEDAADAMREVAEAARGVAEEYRESQANMVDGFGTDTYVSDELGEKADSVDSWAEEIDSAADDLLSADDEGTCGECDLSKDDGPHHEFEASDDDPEKCKEDGCETDEDEHHEFDLDVDAATDEYASIVDELPV